MYIWKVTHGRTESWKNLLRILINCILTNFGFASIKFSDFNADPFIGRAWLSLSNFITRNNLTCFDTDILVCVRVCGTKVRDGRWWDQKWWGCDYWWWGLIWGAGGGVWWCGMILVMDGDESDEWWWRAQHQDPPPTSAHTHKQTAVHRVKIRFKWQSCETGNATNTPTIQGCRGCHR